MLWNPFYHRAYGRVAVGEKLKVHQDLPGTEETTFHPTVTAVVPRQELRWVGRLYLPGLFDVEHDFLLEPLEGGSVLFTQRERFAGALASLIMPGLEAPLRQGLAAMNEAMKARAEAAAAHERAA